jgi:hypothetical protein
MRGMFWGIPRTGSTRFAAIAYWSASSITAMEEGWPIHTRTWRTASGTTDGIFTVTSRAGVYAAELPGDTGFQAQSQGSRTGQGSSTSQV